MSPVEYQAVSLPDFDISEIKRYARTDTFEGLPIEECLDELEGLVGSVAYAEFEITNTQNGIDLGFAETDSENLKKALGNSRKILLFAATLGALPDRLVAKYGKISPTKALLIQAVATERIEALCDAFIQNRKDYYEKSGLRLTPRFSPGYGDLPLHIQTDIIKTLDCNKLLGITLTEGLLMLPTKSVTAIAGIYRV